MIKKLERTIDLNDIMKKKRDYMLSEKINLTGFLVEFIETYHRNNVKKLI